MKPSRREILRTAGAGLGLGLGALGLEPAAGGGAAGDGPQPSKPRREGTVGLPEGWRSIRKIDAHNHVMVPVQRPDADWAPVERMVEAAERLGIEKVCCSRPISGGVLAGVEAVREVNDSILAAMKRFPDRIAGFCFVQPGNGPAALDEIERCLDHGMIGIKLYNQFKFSDPVVYPVAERCVDRRIPFLGHSGHPTDARTRAQQPNISDSLDFCHLSRRYPELMLIMGHVNGGGDWEWAVKGLRDCPNVYLDTSGSVQEDDTIELCVRELGHERMLFATDQAMEGGVGKILSARITAEQREDIFWRNFQGILNRRNA